MAHDGDFHDYVAFRDTKLMIINVKVLGGKTNTIVFPNMLSIRVVYKYMVSVFLHVVACCTIFFESGSISTVEG